MTLTNQQLDVITDREDLDGLQPAEAAEKLREEGHPAFADAPAKGQPQGATGGKPEDVIPFDAGPRQELRNADSPDLPPGTEIATVETPAETALAGPADVYQTGDGLDECDQSDLTIPLLKIKQGQTQDKDGSGVGDVPNGHWFTTLAPEDHAEKKAVAILAMRRCRAWMLPFKAEDAERVADEVYRTFNVEIPQDHKGPICSSNDRITPEPREFGTICDSCEACPAAKWRSIQARGKTIRRQDCGDGYEFLIQDLETGQPAVMRLRSSAVKPTKNLLTRLKFSTQRHKTEMCGFKVEISTKEVEGKDDRGNYFIPQFSAPELIGDEAEVAYLRAQRDGLRWSKAERDEGE